jgi:hypothetical protein
MAGLALDVLNPTTARISFRPALGVWVGVAWEALDACTKVPWPLPKEATLSNSAIAHTERTADPMT